jgi:hypothetical protein
MRAAPLSVVQFVGADPRSGSRKGSEEMAERRKQRRKRQGWILGVAMALGVGAGVGDIASAQVNTEHRFVLSGIVIDARGTARALLEEPQLTGGRSVMLRIGDTIGPYRVASIATDHAVLQGPGGAVVRLPLSGVGGPAVAQPPVAPPAGPIRQKAAAPAPSEEELKRMLTPPPPGVYRHASEGASLPLERPAAVNVEDFKSQIQQHMMGVPR